MRSKRDLVSQNKSSYGTEESTNPMLIRQSNIDIPLSQKIAQMKVGDREVHKLL